MHSDLVLIMPGDFSIDNISSILVFNTFITAGFVFPVTHGLLEALDRRTQIRTNILKTLGAKLHQHDSQNN